MAFDLRLVDGDISLDPFDLELNSPGLEAVGQRIAITLNTFRGEFFLNTEFGAPWYQTVLKKGVSKNLIDTQLRSVISSVEGVLQILEYESTINTQLRDITVAFKARVDEGVVDDIISLGSLIQGGPSNYLLEDGSDLLQEDNTSLYLLE